MHDHKMIREQLDQLRDGMRRRGKLDVLEAILVRSGDLEQERRRVLQAVEERKAKRNAVSQEVGRRRRRGEDADALVQQSRALGEEITGLDGHLAQTQRALDALLLDCLLYTSPSPRDRQKSRMPSSA